MFVSARAGRVARIRPPGRRPRRPAADPSHGTRSPFMCPRKSVLALLTLALGVAPALAQNGGAGLPPVPAQTAPAPATGTAAKVNGQAIPEAAVQRGLRRVPPARQAEARTALLDFLIETALV